ncbi:MAG: HEAT repeat domain-containing protein [Planctomycetes bacterium]|nr:HEAT repeat domain-containing protein [Planctomycetota bacterium]
MFVIRFAVGAAILSMSVATIIVHADELTDDDFAAEQIATVIGQLDDTDVRVRAGAITSLQRIGVEARAAIPRLIELLADEDWYQEFVIRRYVYDMASEALVAMSSESAGQLLERYPLQSDPASRRSIFTARRMRHDARAFLPEIQKLFRTATRADRATWLGTLAAIDPTGQTAVPILVRSLQEGMNSAERRAAAEWLTRAESLEGVYWHEHSSASDWFARTLESNAVADALILALKDPAAEVRGPAALSVSTYPEVAARAVPALIRLLSDQDCYHVMVSNHLGDVRAVRRDAVLALSRMPDFADQSLAAFIQMLKADAEFAKTSELAFAIADLTQHTKQPMRYLTEIQECRHPQVATIALARLGQDSREAIPRLEKLARSGSQDWDREDAQTALAIIDPEGHPDAVTFVREKLQEDMDSGVLDFLAAVGRRASFVFPWLHQRIIEREPGNALDHRILKVLEVMGPDAVPAAPQILKCLESDLDFFLSDYENTLVKLGPGVIPILIDALTSAEPSTDAKMCCLRALGRLGSAASNAVDAVVLQSRCEYPRLRETAANTLGMIASHPGESLPALESLLSDARPQVRAAAASSCGKFGPDARRQVPQLVNRLSDDYLDVRRAAAVGLGQMRSVAAEAIPKLTELSRDKNVPLRDAAMDALHRIQER